MFYCTLLCVSSSIAIILMGKRELVALLNLSSWRLLMVERLFLAVPQGCLWFVIVVFPDHTHLLFFYKKLSTNVGMKTIKIKNKITRVRLCNNVSVLQIHLVLHMWLCFFSVCIRYLLQKPCQF